MWRKVKNKEYFVFPGGGQEVGETLEETVCRELLEETSIIVSVEKLLYKLTDENTEQNFYLCKYISGEPKLGKGNESIDTNESNQYKPLWRNIEEIASLPVLPLEVRDWFLEDYKNNFSYSVREDFILTTDRRKK